MPTVLNYSEKPVGASDKPFGRKWEKLLGLELSPCPSFEKEGYRGISF